MKGEHCCGPDHDKEFFDEVNAVFAKFPEAAKRYAIQCIDHETDILNIDFETTAALKRIENGKIIVEFVPRESMGDRVCCVWSAGRCIQWWDW